MRRLIDDLRAPRAKLEMPRFVREDREAQWQHLALRCMDILRNPQLPVLLIDNVAEYYFGCDQEYWDLRRDFPNLAPPYPQFWCENRLVKRIHSKAKGDTDVSAIVSKGRTGTLITALTLDQVQGQDIPPETKWILWCEIWIDYHFPGVAAQGPHGSIMVAIDGEGRCIERPCMMSFAPAGLENLMQSLMTWVHPAFLAISFLHCKNVSVIDHKEPAKKAREFQRKNGVAPTPYKTLVIEPLKQVLRTEGRSGEVGLPKAMHICRGHFRDYREGRGLFGKIHQLVWMPSIVRGKKGDKASPREVEIKL